MGKGKSFKLTYIFINKVYHVCASQKCYTPHKVSFTTIATQFSSEFKLSELFCNAIGVVSTAPFQKYTVEAHKVKSRQIYLPGHTLQGVEINLTLDLFQRRDVGFVIKL